MINLFRSLVLTTVLSFATPVFLMVSLFISLSAVSYVPGIAFLGQNGATQMVDFLTVFGDGYPTEGILIIGLTCGIVGGLFDLFNFYIYQNPSLRSH